MRTAFLLVVWVLTRAAVLWLFFGPDAWVTGDVAYFDASLRSVPSLGLGQVLVEYPLPAVGVLAVPWLVARAVGGEHTYADLVMVTALLTDAAFTLLLYRYGGTRRLRATAVWVLGVPLLGATAYARFDLLPGVLVGAAVLLLPRHPRVAALSAALATGVKLWPAMLLPQLVAAVRRRGRVLAVLAVTGVVLAGGSLAVAGWDRLVSPLTFQAGRGLQIESLLATPAMLGWWLRPDTWTVTYASSHAYEVTGPAVPALVHATTLLTVLFVLALLAAWVAVYRLPGPLPVEGMVWLSLAAVTGFVLAGKVLSPQYLLWLLPMAAAGVAVVARGQRRLLAWCALLLVATGLTQLVFPTSYTGMIAHTGITGRAVLLLAARNLLLVWLFLLAAAQTYGVLREAQRGSALERQPAGPESSAARTFR
ncbi:MAG: glycosyltransferase 87 family protein [Nocardioidaceae bacterium]